MKTLEGRRVAVVAPSLDILGGQGVQARSLIDALCADGCRATLVPINPEFPRVLRRVRAVPYLRTLVNQAWYLPSLLRLATADVAHVFSASYASFLLAPVPAMLAAKAFGRRVVLHYHSGEADDHLANWGPLVHPWLKLADALVVPSEYLARVFARYGHDAIVVPNVVDVSRFRFRMRRPFWPRLLSTRNLEPYYGIDVILDAFARIRAAVPEATLTVAGYGSLEARLRHLAPEGVRFVGKVDPDDMPRLYDEADIFLNASIVDNQPVSILEAFASGLPVVTTPAGDIPAAVHHERTGLLVPVNDPIRLARAVLALIANPDWALDMAARARQHVARHTWPAVRDAWIDVYDGPHPRPAADARPATSTSDSWTAVRHL